jgi:hypothetical protein
MVVADSVEMVDLKVNVLDNDAAIVTGRSIMKNAKLNPPNTKPIDISGEYRFVDTFVRRNGEWKLVAGISTEIQNLVPSASPGASPAAGDEGLADNEGCANAVTSGRESLCILRAVMGQYLLVHHARAHASP